MTERKPAPSAARDLDEMARHVLAWLIALAAVACVVTRLAMEAAGHG